MIRLEHVSYRYLPSGPPALDDVSLRIEPEEIVGVLGVNGSGKTTLLRLCSGLMRQQEGIVEVGGRTTPQDVRSVVALEPDDAGVYPYLTVAEAGEFLGQALPAWDRERWSELCELLGLPLQRRPAELSKGQRSRVRLAQALSQRLPVLLLDEPLAGIDLPSRERIARSLAADFAARPRTVLLATHEIAEIEGLFGRVIVLDEGRVAVDASADDLRTASAGSIQDFLRRGEW